MRVTGPSQPTRGQRIAHVSTFPPLLCGIASFVSDLIAAIPQCEHRRYVLHYGKGQSPGGPAQADVNSPMELAGLARTISASDCDVVSLQHEFGIWGGPHGTNIHAFLDHLTKPVVSVLHTTFAPGERNDAQRSIVRRLVDQSNAVVVLTKESRMSVDALCGSPADHIWVIPHGVPEIPYIAPDGWETDRKNGIALRMLSLGFVAERKGFEPALRAVKYLSDLGYTISYKIVGGTQKQFDYEAPYVARIENLIERLGLESIVSLESRYASLEEQIALIQNSHVGLLAYQDTAQASSGIVPLFLAAGRPVICTPFDYAKAKAREGRGVLVANGLDWESVARGIEQFIATRGYQTLARAIYDRTRPWQWSAVGRTFSDLYAACDAAADSPPAYGMTG